MTITLSDGVESNTYDLTIIVTVNLNHNTPPYFADWDAYRLLVAQKLGEIKVQLPEPIDDEKDPV